MLWNHLLFILVLYLFEKYPTPCRQCFVVLMLLFSFYFSRFCVICSIWILILFSFISVNVACLFVMARRVLYTPFALWPPLDIVRCLEIVLIWFVFITGITCTRLLFPISSYLFYYSTLSCSFFLWCRWLAFSQFLPVLLALFCWMGKNCCFDDSWLICNWKLIVIAMTLSGTTLIALVRCFASTVPVLRLQYSMFFVLDTGCSTMD